MKNTNSLKYKKLYKILLDQIRSGNFKPGKSIPTERELADHFNVSRPTVSKALKELQDEGYLERRQRSGTYIKPEAARLKIGVFFPWIFSNTNVQTVFDAFTSALSSMSSTYNTVTVVSNLNVSDIETCSEEELSYQAQLCCQELFAAGISGVLFMPFEVYDKQKMFLNDNVIQSFKSAEIPVVLIDRDVYFHPDRSEFDLVSTNHVTGICKATEHLIHQGCRKLLFVSSRTTSSAIQKRISGFQTSLLKHRLDLSRCPVIHMNHLEPQSAIEEILKHDIDGIVCINDTIAACTMQQLQLKGISIPNQIKITGFDNLPMSQYLTPPLTTIHQPMDKIATTALKTLVERIQNPTAPSKEIHLDTELIIRKSCGEN